MKQQFFILVLTFLAVEIEGPGVNQNNINFNLETAFVFDPKDSYYDISLISTLKNFLDSLQNAITNRKTLRNGPVGQYKFSDFIYELGLHILHYNDDNIRSFAKCLNNVVEDYYPSGTMYNRIIFDPRLKAFLKSSLKEWTETDPKIIRDTLKRMYAGPMYNETFVNFVHALNQFYDAIDADDLKKYAKKFETFPKTQTKLESNIDKTLNKFVFERYKKLNVTMKSILVQELAKVADYAMVEFRNRSVDPEFYNLRKRSFDNMTLEDFLTPDEKDDAKFSGSEREDFPPRPNDSFEQTSKTSLSKTNSLTSTAETKTTVEDVFNSTQHEIVFSKVIEINVRKKSLDEDKKTP